MRAYVQRRTCFVCGRRRQCEEISRPIIRQDAKGNIVSLTKRYQWGCKPCTGEAFCVSRRALEGWSKRPTKTGALTMAMLEDDARKPPRPKPKPRPRPY